MASTATKATVNRFS